MSRRHSDADTTRLPRRADGTGSDIPQCSAEVNFATSSPSGTDEWSVVVDTASGKVNGDGGPGIITAGEHFEMPARSLLLLRR